MQRWEQGTLGADAYSLCFARLSIVDLSEAASQPMSNEDGSLVMLFNGEIYNSPELRHLCESKGHRFRSNMDGEVILHLWEMEGTAALARLNGIFAVAIVDKSRGEVVLARDPVGVKPLFYSESAGQLWFASELSSLASAGAPMGSPDRVGLAQFLTFLWIPAPRTPYVGARSVEPGCLVRWRDGSVQQQARYSAPLFPAEQPDPIDDDTALAEGKERLVAAVKRQLLGDVPIGVMASGGIDSSLIWWAGGDAIQRGFHIRWAGNHATEHLEQDTDAVRRLEGLLGTPIEYIRGERAALVRRAAAGDLFADPAHSLTALIARRARELGLKVLLSGQGGDEVFAGYRRHRVVRLLARPAIRHVASKLRGLAPGRSDGLRAEYGARLMRAAAQHDLFSAYMQLCTYSDAAERASALGCSTSEVADEIVWQQHRAVWDAMPRTLTPLRRALTLDLAVYLPGLGLAYVDRAGMGDSVEIRVPWLDLEFIRWTLTLPDGALARGARGKWLPRRLAAAHLEHAMASQSKRGFGAPIERIRQLGQPGAALGARGFRQGHYFALARTMLDSFIVGETGNIAAVL